MPALEEPVTSTLTRLVALEPRSRTKISGASLVSLLTRLLAAEEKATNCPFEEMEGKFASAFAPLLPAMSELTRIVVLLARSLTKTLRYGLTGVLVTRFFAWLTKTMNCPSVLKMGVKELPAPATLVRSIVEMEPKDTPASETEFAIKSIAIKDKAQWRSLFTSFN